MNVSPKILLLDGDEAVRTALAFSLELQDYSVTACAEPEELVALARGGEADCIVIDHRPGTLGAMFLHETLRSIGISAPVIITATYPRQSLVQAAIAAGAVLIEKPLLADDLAACIAACLASKAA
jgi:FixJ family two-component response regulator